MFFYLMFLMDVLIQLKKWIGKAMCVLLFDTLINRLIWKGMSNIYYWKKLTFSKPRFPRKENLQKSTNFEEQEGTRCIRGNVLYWNYCLQLPFGYKTVSQISFKFFCSGGKSLLSELLWKLGWFQGHNERFPKYLS